MIDGIHFDSPASLFDAGTSSVDAPYSRRSSAPLRFPSVLTDLVEWLPRLGSVLWLERANAPMLARPDTLNGQTLVFDHPAMRVLASCTVLRAHHRLTPQGPREWLSIEEPRGTAQAKLYLLPDSDLLAWDQMCSAAGVTTAATDTEPAPTHAHFLRRALGWFEPRWQASLLEFRVRRQPWVSILDAQPPLRLSLLGMELARSIVETENAEWRAPLHHP